MAERAGEIREGSSHPEREASEIVSKTRSRVGYLGTALAVILLGTVARDVHENTQSVIKDYRAGTLTSRLETGSQKPELSIDEKIAGAREHSNRSGALLELFHRELGEGRAKDAEKVAKELEFDPAAQELAYRELVRVETEKGDFVAAREMASNIKDSTVREEVLKSIDAEERNGQHTKGEPEQGETATGWIA